MKVLRPILQPSANITETSSARLQRWLVAPVAWSRRKCAKFQPEMMMEESPRIGSGDRSRVNLNEPFEVSYWRSKFRCSRAELEMAVQEVGVLAVDVEAHFAKRNDDD